MSTPTNPLDALIAAYIQAIEAGQVPIRRELLDQNPEQAEALQTFFADFDRMDRVAAPLRMAGEVDETAALDGHGLTHLPTLRYFGDYELLEEIARGGMGVVYKARQASLNRMVAIKMILAGTFATPRDVARFQAEAEAAANLDHPHIVPVYEVGEHEGQQYFSMKFVEGGSLANHPRGEVKAEVIGLITIARAVHHAHQHGVLHRDLKPSNVLVDPKGDRHVTDFGLAKRLTDLDRSLTEAGQILGTPRYMSPEQAAGRKDLTVAADVYALGVILYERLTGRTPFDGLTAIALVRQVRETEPPRPSTIRPGLDRDLETMVLKCLEKDATRRYPTAEDLVEDLTRWYEGRPITARPVGQTERFVRWCRRNPAVAGLAASVALVLLIGAAVSSLLAFQERKARIRAENAEDMTERAYSRSFVRPLRLDGLGQLSWEPHGVKKPNLSEPEVEALWELATSTTESLRDKFLEEATREPLTLSQLSARSESALIANLGLDPDRRAQAVGLLLERLRRTDLTSEARAAISFLALEIDDGSSPWGEEAVEIIDRALDGPMSADSRTSLEKKIAGSCELISPSKAATLLASAVVRTRDNQARTLLGGILATLSSRLDSSQAASTFGPAARSITEAIKAIKPDEGGINQSLAKSLTLLASQLDPAEAATIARSIAQAIEREKNYFSLRPLSKALASLSARMTSAEAEALCGPIARIFINAFENTTDDNNRRELIQALMKLIGRLDQAQSTISAKLIAQAIGRDETGFGYRADSLDSTESWDLWRDGLGPAAASLIARSIAEVIREEKNERTLIKLVGALKSISRRLDSAEAMLIAQPVAEAIERETERQLRSNPVEPPAALTTPFVGASVVAKSIAQGIGREGDGFVRAEQARALALVTASLGPGRGVRDLRPGCQVPRRISQTLY